ncbi:MAG: hypothetical protein P1V51_08020 [Deltaproteobacteria bacterium]|nr:hypothetical protein [Deltaproteobacteria bacterium]
MRRVGHLLALLALLLLSPAPAAAEETGAAPADALTPPVISAEQVPGWGDQEEQVDLGRVVDDGAPLPLAGIGASLATRTRLETGLAVGARVPTFAEAQLRGLVRSPKGVVFGVAVPILLTPSLPESPVDTGNIAVEAHWSLANPSARTSQFWLGSLRFIFPAGTRNSLFMMVPGRDRSSGGLEAAATYRRQEGAWAFHVEGGGGLYVDNLMALRMGFSGTAAYRPLPFLDLFAQADPWLIWIPRPVTDPGGAARATFQLAGALGVSLNLGRFGIRLAYQRVVPHANDHHLWMVLDLLLDVAEPSPGQRED